MTATLKTTVIQEPGSSVQNIVLGGSGQVGFGGANYGTAGALIVSGGASAPPSWGAFAINVQEFTASGSGTPWTKPAGAAFSQIIVIGGGGAGGASGGNFSMCSTIIGGGGGGGGAGGTAILWKVASALGATETVTVGAAASTSSFGTHCSGTGGTNGAAGGSSTGGAGGIGGSGSGTGAIAITGTPGTTGAASETSNSECQGGNGGSSFLGAGGRGTNVSTNPTPNVLGVRGGGSAGESQNNAGYVGTGSVGYVVVITYCLQ
jgi:hypothetical protein